MNPLDTPRIEMLFFINRKKKLLSPWRTQVVRMINEFLGISSSEKKQRSFHSEYTFAHLPHFLTATYFTYHLIYGHYHVSTSKKAERKKKEEKNVTVKNRNLII